jgi:TolA-binding protein
LGILIRMLDDLQDNDLAYQLLAAYQLRYPTGGSLAEVYFRLGQLHELVAAYLDFKKAREYYGRVVREFPESVYYGPARERIAYINRHYFRVQ